MNGVNEYLEADLNTGSSPPDPVALTHDANPGAPGQAGNLTVDPTAPNVGAGEELGQRYIYDVENRLTAVYRTEGTEATGDDTLLLEIRYDALNRRVETIERVDTDSGLPLATPAVTRHIHAGLTTIEEYGIGGDGTSGYTTTLLREFLWGDRFPEPVALVDHTAAGVLPPPGETGGGQEVFHYLLDDLGSVVGLTDAGDPGDPNATPPIPPTPPKLVERYTYDPYGATYIEIPDGSGGWTFTDPVTTQRFARSTLGNPFMWTGQRYDPTTRLYHFWARAYSPRLGRWLQRDPIGYVDGVSLYEFVASYPLLWTDPLGLDGVGHHYVPEAVRELAEEGLSEEAYKAFKDAVSGQTDPSHGWSKAHEEYSEAVKKELEDYMGRKGISKKRKMTKAEAEEFLKLLKKSQNAKIRAFLKAVEEAAKRFRNQAIKKAVGKGVKKAAKGAVRKVPVVAVGLFLWDVHKGGVGHAVNETLWPISELWCRDSGDSGSGGGGGSGQGGDGKGNAGDEDEGKGPPPRVPPGVLPLPPKPPP